MLCRTGDDFRAQLRVRREHAMEAACPEPVGRDQMQARTRHQGGEPLHEFHSVWCFGIQAIRAEDFLDRLGGLDPEVFAPVALGLTV